jgi:hypothetical protein
VLPVVDDEPDAPDAVMLPSACFSTETLQVSPDAVLPVFTIVSAQTDPVVVATSAITAISVLAWAICHSLF